MFQNQNGSRRGQSARLIIRGINNPAAQVEERDATGHQEVSHVKQRVPISSAVSLKIDPQTAELFCN